MAGNARWKMLQVQLVNLNMTRKVRARSSLFFHKSFLARGFDVSPLVDYRRAR